VPLPEGFVQEEIQSRQHNLAHQLESAGLTKDAYLAAEGQTEEEFDAEIEERARDAIKAQFVLEQLAEREQVGVSEAELTDHILRSSMRYGISPEQFIQQVSGAGQLPVLVGEIRRGKALEVVVGAATVVDESGNPIDLAALRAELQPAPVTMEADDSEDLEDLEDDAEDEDEAGTQDVDVAAGSEPVEEPTVS
jgi:trigger factor